MDVSQELHSLHCVYFVQYHVLHKFALVTVVAEKKQKQKYNQISSGVVAFKIPACLLILSLVHHMIEM